MNVLAKALYDNSAEAPDELEFRKGDVITVIEQNTGGLEGWWLCSLNGRQGIAPGNRLKIMAGMFDTSFVNSKLKKNADIEAYTYDTLPSRKKVVDTAPGQETYDIPPRREQHPAAHLGYRTVPGTRRQASKELHKEGTDGGSVVNQRKPPQTQAGFSQDIYDVPPSHSQAGPNNNLGPTEHYDTLPNHGGGGVDRHFVANIKPKTIVGHEKSANTDGYGSPKKVNNISQLKISAPSSSPMDIYDAPSAFKQQQLQQQEVYDVPPSHSGVFFGEVYDIPTHSGSLPNSPRDKNGTKRVAGHKVITKTYSQDIYDVPPSHSALHAKQSMDYTYDVPPQVSRDKPGDAGKVLGGLAVQDSEGKVSILSLGKNPRSENSDDIGFSKGMLEIAREDAEETLMKKQQNLDTSSAYLLSYVSSTWRKMGNLEARVFEIRAACNQLKLASKEYLEFSEGVVANALQIHDAALFAKLTKLLGSLKTSYEGMEKTATSMSDMNWEAAKLCSKPDNDDALLDSFVLSTKDITDCAKRFCSVVQENISALFKKTGNMKERPLPTPPSETGSLRGSTWVAAEKEGMVSKEPAQPLQVRPLPSPPQNVPNDDDMMNTYEELASVNERNQEPAKIADYGYLSKDNHIIPLRQEDVLSEKEKQILQFYSGEVNTLSNSVTLAVESFFSSVEADQLPKVFVSHSKHVIILGHKLVFIGDTIHLNVQNNSLKQRIITTNDTLCECLSSAVSSTKAAALQYPRVPPMQEMVDRITDVANATQDLRNLILVGEDN